MIETLSPLESNHVRAVALISDKLKLSADEVARIYRNEFERLARTARIPTFLVVLAMRNTQSILRKHHGRGTLH